MPAPLRLQEVPAKFFDRKKWNWLRSSASSELLALCYLNAPYPNPRDPCDLLCARGRSRKQAVKLYRHGRELVNTYRLLLLNGKHVATGVGPDGERVKIPPTAWMNLWPLFATERANGPHIMYKEIEISETDRQARERDCVIYLTSHPKAAEDKKIAVFAQAKARFGGKLSHATFNSAYQQVVKRGRGRPRKQAEIKK